MAKSLAAVAVEHFERIEAQRDQLDQQVRELLQRVEALRSRTAAYPTLRDGPENDLFATAQRIREERGE